MNNYIYWAEDNSEAIEHYGIVGQKWGKRRYQYEDGSLTSEGIRRYRNGEKKTSKSREPRISGRSTSLSNAEFEKRVQEIEDFKREFEENQRETANQVAAREREFEEQKRINMEQSQKFDELLTSRSDPLGQSVGLVEMVLSDPEIKTAINKGITQPINTAIKTYVSGWNTIKDTYVSGLKTIGNWFKW